MIPTGHRSNVPLRAWLLPALLLVFGGATGCGGGGGGGGGSTGGGGRALAVVDSVTPADGSSNVDAGTTVTLRFRTAMEDAVLRAGGLVLVSSATGAPVSADIDVAPDLYSATIVPDVPLAGGVLHQVRLSATARTYGGREIRRPWFSEFRVRASDGGGGGGGGTPVQGGLVRGVGSLAKGRSHHGAALLGDGRVAVFGGFDTESTVTGSIEVFDPEAETWTTDAATLGTARARVTATTLPDGTVFVAGGQTASTTSVGEGRWEVWDPLLHAVTRSGTMAERRTRHRAVRLPSGKVLLVGGSRTDTDGAPEYSRNSAEVWDPATGASTAVLPMAVARSGHEATLLGNGRVLVTGGHGSDVRAELFDPVTGLFTAAGSMLVPRRGHTATLLADGNVLLAGGTTAELWLAAESRFVAVQNPGDERSLHTAVRIPNGRVYIAGGEKPAVAGGTFFHTSVEFYDPPGYRFLQSALNMRTYRSAHTATVLVGGEILLVGGKGSVPGAPAQRTCDRVRLD